MERERVLGAKIGEEVVERGERGVPGVEVSPGEDRGS